MRIPFRLLAAFAAAVTFISPTWAQVKDTAEFFPAHTLAYVEVRHPDQLSRELSGLLKGSYLEDLPAAIAKIREKHDPGEADDELVALALPEMLAEFRRFQGGAFALTGFDKDNEPEFAAILLTGDSNVPSFILRMYLTLETSIRIVEEQEGVKIYREKHEAVDGALFREFTGPAFAVMHGAVIIGSTQDHVKDVIQRVKGKTSDPSLANKTAFKEAAKVREKPGLFAYVNVADLGSRLDEVLKDKDADYAAEWAMLKTVLNPKAFRYATASISLHNGDVDCQAQLILEPGQSSPLLELLPDRKVPVELLRAPPKGVLLSATITLPYGEKRWARLLKLADELGKSEDDAGEQTSKILADLEKKLRLKIGKERLSKMSGVSLIARLADVDKDGEAVVPKESQILLATTISQGKQLIVAIEPKAPAETPSTPRKEAHPADQKVAAAIKEIDDAVILGIGSLGETLMLVYHMTKADEDEELIPLAWGGSVIEIKKPAPEDEFAKELAKLVEPLPPAVISLSRKSDRLVLEARQPHIKSVTARAINIFVDAAVERAGKRGDKGLLAGGVAGGGILNPAVMQAPAVIPAPLPAAAPANPIPVAQ